MGLMLSLARRDSKPAQRTAGELDIVGIVGVQQALVGRYCTRVNNALHILGVLCNVVHRATGMVDKVGVVIGQASH